jgi:hypothetical protein
MTEPADDPSAEYPIDFEVPLGDGRRDRWFAAAGIVLLKIVLLLPHLILLFLLGLVVQVLVWIGYWGIAITGHMPDLIRSLEIIFLAWMSRVTAWFVGTMDAYPTFGTDTKSPAQVTVAEPPEPQSRLLAILGIFGIRTLLALPHLFVLFWLSLGTIVAAWVGYVIVVITGRLPIGLYEYLVAYHRWWARTWGWIAGLTDEYPPFTLEY